VLWRLARAGCLQDIEYLVVVSGGSYIAAAFASHVIEAGGPAEGEDLSAWYLDVVARTICRMQGNMPYLARDLGKGMLAVPTDGSSCLPRIFDIPILLATCVLSLFLPAVFQLILFVIPCIEMLHNLLGGVMRRTFCLRNLHIDKFGAFSLQWPHMLSRERLIILFAVIFAIMFVAHLLLMKKCKGGHHRWLLINSTRAALMRFIILWVFVLVLVMASTTIRIWEYKLHDETDQTRLCLCDRYREHREQIAIDCSDIPMEETEPWYTFIQNATYCPSSDIAPRDEALRNPLQTFVVWWLPLGLLVSVLLSPWFPKLFLKGLNFMGPILVVLFLCCLIQLRIFGPITGDTFLHVSLSYNSDTVQYLFLAAGLVQPFLNVLKTTMHRFYRRSLRRAFFAGGRDVQWRDVSGSPYCPFLLINATVNDYMRPQDRMPLNEISLSPWHMGGRTTGYVPMPGHRSLARSVALSGAAIDAFILGKHDHIEGRFWKELLGLSMGDFLRWPRCNSRQPSLLRERKSRCKINNLDLSVLVTAEIYYAVLWVANWLTRAHMCSPARKLYAAAFLILLTLILLSFYAFLPWLDVLLHWVPIRAFHLLTQFQHRAERPPSLVYVTDGGLLDNTGVMQLLRRRCRRILLVYGGNDPQERFKWLVKLTEAAATERIASFYDPVDPRRDVRETWQEYSKDAQAPYLHLGIYYGWGSGPEERSIGDLFIVTNNRVTPCLRAMRVQPLLTEDEIRGSEAAHGPTCMGRLRQVDLGGCCCDCCHWNGLNFGRKFPNPHNANQCLTPQLFNSLCRLGFCVSEEAVEAVRKCGSTRGEE